jgi:hypothetical protein
LLFSSVLHTSSFLHWLSIAFYVSHCLLTTQIVPLCIWSLNVIHQLIWEISFAVPPISFFPYILESTFQIHIVRHNLLLYVVSIKHPSTYCYLYFFSYLHSSRKSLMGTPTHRPGIFGTLTEHI